MRIVERARRAGCLANLLVSFALFFGVGFIVSLFSGDMLTTIQALVMTVLLGGAGLWVERRRVR